MARDIAGWIQSGDFSHTPGRLKWFVQSCKKMRSHLSDGLDNSNNTQVNDSPLSHSLTQIPADCRNETRFIELSSAYSECKPLIPLEDTWKWIFVRPSL
jgi:hypothetical protein